MPAPQYPKGVLYALAVAELQPDPNQPRKVIDPLALEDLKESIAKVGIKDAVEAWLNVPQQ